MREKTLEWIGATDGCLELIDQRLLPAEFKKIRCRNVNDLFNAIKTLAVRGAPAIGVAAAYGMVLAAHACQYKNDTNKLLEYLQQQKIYLASCRPTAVNLQWALDKVFNAAKIFISKNNNCQAASLRNEILRAAHEICKHDIDMCKKIGLNGRHLITSNAGVLTHCNAGALATAGQGTALSLMFEAHDAGTNFKVYADETRPLLQGARLTSWELNHAGIDVTVICDNMAGWLMKQGKINLVITGADRIAANGDSANKIGTYSLSILAKAHGIPFYIAAPSSTFDLSINSGNDIPIEQRSPLEITCFANTKITPDEVNVYNPAFDVVRASDITAIITEQGLIENPDADKIKTHLK
ncbi:MAG TPA: S-methyl-5-thioribose-1-phosphate isomerase [Sedimentisphaerales bacterium]|nr:S-methyl-5-thioribose-1-phosphate isomerase [Sedimentisphaerales bacterium]